MAPALSEGRRDAVPGEAKSTRRPLPAAPPATLRTATHGQRTHPQSLCRPGLPHSARSPDRSPLREVVTIAVAVAKASDTTTAAAPSRPRPLLCSRLLLQQAPSYPRGPKTRIHFLPEWSGPTPSGPAHSAHLRPNLLSRRSSGFKPRPDCFCGLSIALCWLRSPRLSKRLKCSQAHQARRKGSTRWCKSRALCS